MRAVAVFAVAAGVRLLLVATSSGGFTGNIGYDQSVYFTAADALTYGRMPYADFVLLHPPGLMLVLTPFALLARVIGDHPAFVTANVVFACIGGLNAALITRVAVRWGMGNRAAWAGGIFYAVWLSAAAPEQGARLEPLGTLAFLVAVLALGRADRPPGRAAVLAGTSLGFAATVKIWWVAPLLVLLIWFGAVRRDGRTVRCLAGGALATVAVVAGPFFAAAPTAMWRMVVADQLGRNGSHTSRIGRLAELSSIDQVAGSRLLTIAVVIVLGAAGLAIVIVAWRRNVARPIVLVAAAQLVVLLLSPSYFGYYSGFFAAGAALVLAASVGPGPRPDSSRVSGSGVMAAAVVVLVTGGITLGALVTTPAVATPTPLSVADVPRRIGSVRCVVSDSPMALIALDALSRGLSSGCPNWVDVSGRTYDVDANPGRHLPRTRNQKWQRDVTAYLLSGQAVVVIRRATGLSRQTRATIGALPVLARHGKVVVHRVR